MVNFVKMDDSLLGNLLNFKEEKFLVYGKDGETIGTLNISLQFLEKNKIIWFEFNFESFNVFKTSLKTRFSIPKLLVEDNDLELTVKNETLANIMGEIKIELEH